MYEFRLRQAGITNPNLFISQQHLSLEKNECRLSVAERFINPDNLYFMISDADSDVTAPIKINKYFDQFQDSGRLHLLKRLVEIIDFTDTRNGGWTGGEYPVLNRLISALNHRDYVGCLGGRKKLMDIFKCADVQIEELFAFCLNHSSSDFETIITQYLEKKTKCQGILQRDLKHLRRLTEDCAFHLETGNDGMEITNTGVTINNKELNIAITLNCQPDGKKEAWETANSDGNWTPVGIFARCNEGKWQYTWNAPNPGEFESEEEYQKVRSTWNAIRQLIFQKDAKLNGDNETGIFGGGSWRSGGSNGPRSITPDQIKEIIEEYAKLHKISIELDMI